MRATTIKRKIIAQYSQNLQVGQNGLMLCWFLSGIKSTLGRTDLNFLNKK